MLFWICSVTCTAWSIRFHIRLTLEKKLDSLFDSSGSVSFGVPYTLMRPISPPDIKL